MARAFWVEALCLLSTIVSGVAWDPFHIGSSIAKKIEKAGDHLIGNAKAAFEEAMQTVIDQDINPLVDKVNAMILEDAGAVKQDVEDVVANATREIEGLIDHAAFVAQSLMDHEIQEIEDKIIDEAAAKVNACTDHFFQGLDGVLQHLYTVVKKINCMVQGDIDKVYEDVYKLIGTGCVLPDKCCREGGVAFKSLKAMGDSQLYALEICRRTSGLTPATSTTEMQKAYVDAQIIAKKFYCIDYGTGSARDYFTKEYNKWGVKYDFWSHQDARGGGVDIVNSKTGTPLRDDPCGSPVDCYQQAIAKLEQARKEISDKADRSSVDPLIAMQKEELKLFHGDACPDGWTESPLTKGYLLVGRPDGAKSGMQLNSPLANGEKGRVGAHGHSVDDPGHGHAVIDPGHTHASGMHGGSSGPRSASHDYSGHIAYTINTESSLTGISLARATTGIAIPASVVSGLDSTDHYPLSYVLVCQQQASEHIGSAPVMV